MHFGVDRTKHGRSSVAERMTKKRTKRTKDGQALCGADGWTMFLPKVVTQVATRKSLRETVPDSDFCALTPVEIKRSELLVPPCFCCSKNEEGFLLDVWELSHKVIY